MYRSCGEPRIEIIQVQQIPIRVTLLIDWLFQSHAMSVPQMLTSFAVGLITLVIIHSEDISTIQFHSDAC